MSISTAVREAVNQRAGSRESSTSAPSATMPDSCTIGRVIPPRTSHPSSHVSHTEASNISGTRGWKHPVSPISTFVDMSRTVRVNVLSPQYMSKGNESLFIRNIIMTLMKNLEASWKEKTDFWANNAINYVYSIAYKCFKERKLGICTLPHVIALALSDSNLVFHWLSEDPEIALNMSSMLTAWKLGAQQQTAGAVSSAQTPLVLLNNKYIFWVLSPLPEEEFSLDITNKEHPTLLCVGNAPTIKEAVSPAISCIGSVLMSQMNNPGKATSIFMVDEFPTILLQGIDTFIGTARKHNVATILAVQDFNQAVRDYGEKSANILKASCGTQAYGMTGNEKTAKDIENLLGEKKEAQESYSHQAGGNNSVTESLQKRKSLKGKGHCRTSSRTLHWQDCRRQAAILQRADGYVPF